MEWLKVIFKGEPGGARVVELNAILFTMGAAFVFRITLVPGD